MALSTDTPRSFVESLNGGVIVDFPLLADTVIYRGSAISKDTSGWGNAQQADEPFVGISLEGKTASGTSGGSTAKIQVGGAIQLPLSGATVADVGEGVFATDDGTFTLANTTSAGVGRVIHVPATGTVWVQLTVPGAQVVQEVVVGDS